MPLGTNHLTNTTSAVFIPELWMNEVRAFLRANLVIGNHVKFIPMQGKKGDVLHIPDISELVTNAKAASTQVTLQSPTETEFTLTINQHEETSVLLEDLTMIQSAYDLRTEYTSSGAYAIAKKIDSDLHGLESGLTNRVTADDGSTAYTGANAAAWLEAGVRQVMETLDTANVSSDRRVMIVHPAAKNELLAIQRFVEYQMIGNGNMPLRTGAFGQIYGMEVFVSTQVPLISANGYANLVMHPNAFALAVQQTPRVQACYKQEYLGWMVTIDVVYGFAEFRDNHAVAAFSPQ